MALGYLVGSIPWGVVLTRVTGAGDLRTIGSGSTGATNVLRTGRRWLAAATLLLDLLKGAAAVLIASALFSQAPLVAAMAAGAGAVVGHCYPVWLGFRGGKGVATLMGVVLALAWPVGLVFAAIWLVLLATTRISSIAGMGAAASAPLTAWMLGKGMIVPVLLGLAVLVLWRHRANIVRLLQGTEPRVGGRGSAEGSMP
ncbi:glycerol-3-phosphate 1-O-acyltransferase PlsY [Croceicoccus sp. F390]|uniref:Glycerol-3-phosphate acyltransferase n=1 Tax=Croceicoccus esteveae TaxID=3075597 RepID=A0ABU2ZFZ5_9SPHN|nr:glycerol-3-phosphate 1-O-acyltransferase PlsY [Croceicoccus sp. F390]MDT0575281.1 glycerol-3-phosphate 1-O-acyltransferase PlsY [Croceicoccus sp. F390]